MNLTGKRVLIVGASGKIGFMLAERLAGTGAELYGAARFSNATGRQQIEALGVRTIAYDAKSDNPDRLPEADLVIFQIWAPWEHTGPDAREAIWQLNYRGVGRIAERYAGRAHIINGSSGNIYGTGSTPFAEDDPARPDSEYGLARFAQERLLEFLTERAGSCVLHLRYLFGNTAETGQIYRAARAILEGAPQEGPPEQRLQVIALEDIVELTYRAIELVDSNHAHAINICHPTVLARRQLAEMVQQELGEGQIIFQPDHGGADRSLVGDPSRMLEQLGAPAVPIEELVRRAARAAH